MTPWRDTSTPHTQDNKHQKRMKRKKACAAVKAKFWRRWERGWNFHSTVGEKLRTPFWKAAVISAKAENRQSQTTLLPCTRWTEMSMIYSKGHGKDCCWQRRHLPRQWVGVSHVSPSWNTQTEEASDKMCADVGEGQWCKRKPSNQGRAGEPTKTTVGKWWAVWEWIRPQISGTLV